MMKMEIRASKFGEDFKKLRENVSESKPKFVERMREGGIKISVNQLYKYEVNVVEPKVGKQIVLVNGVKEVFKKELETIGLEVDFVLDK